MKPVFKVLTMTVVSVMMVGCAATTQYRSYTTYETPDGFYYSTSYSGPYYDSRYEYFRSYDYVNSVHYRYYAFPDNYPYNYRYYYSSDPYSYGWRSYRSWAGYYPSW